MNFPLCDKTMCLYDDLKCQQLTVTFDTFCESADCGEGLFKNLFVENIRLLLILNYCLCHYLLLYFLPSIFIHDKIKHYHKVIRYNCRLLLPCLICSSTRSIMYDILIKDCY